MLVPGVEQMQVGSRSSTATWALKYTARPRRRALISPGHWSL